MDNQRRKFCQVAGLAVVGGPLLLAHGTGCHNSGDPGGAVWTINAFKAQDVMLGDAMIVQLSAPNYPSANLYFCRDAGGLYVMDANCTHANCVLSWDDPTLPMKFLCTCHGSTFDYNGQNNTPPAPAPLPHYKLTVASDGTLVVDVGTMVDATTRTAG
jgi:Rieske Fe-S protein